MRITKMSMSLFLGIIVLVTGLLLLSKSPPHYPLTLTFLGYSLDSNSQRTASFCMSNHSGKPVVYLAEGPSLPHYYYTSQPFHDTKTGWTGVRDYRSPISTSIAQASLLPNCSITFQVPLTAGISNVKVGIHYVPHHFPLRSKLVQILELITGSAAQAYENLELLTPFR